MKVHLCVALKLQSMLLHNMSHHHFQFSITAIAAAAAPVDRVIEINFPDLLVRSDGGNCFPFLTALAFWLLHARVNY